MHIVAVPLRTLLARTAAGVVKKQSAAPPPYRASDQLSWTWPLFCLRGYTASLLLPGRLGLRWVLCTWRVRSWCVMLDRQAVTKSWQLRPQVAGFPCKYTGLAMPAACFELEREFAFTISFACWMSSRACSWPAASKQTNKQDNRFHIQAFAGNTLST